MKILIKYLTIIFLIAVALSPTFTQDISKTNSLFKKLIGAWVWVKSYGGIPYRVETPKTRGYNILLTFTKDSTYTRWTDQDSLLSYSQFKFTFDSDNYLLINGKIKQIDFSGQDSLYISDICTDCLAHLYIRKK